jgi:hypothetical protein
MTMITNSSSVPHPIEHCRFDRAVRRVHQQVYLMLTGPGKPNQRALMVEPETDARRQGVGVFVGAAPPVEIADVTVHKRTFERLDFRHQLTHAGIVVFTGIET